MTRRALSTLLRRPRWLIASALASWWLSLYMESMRWGHGALWDWAAGALVLFGALLVVVAACRYGRRTALLLAASPAMVVFYWVATAAYGFAIGDARILGGGMHTWSPYASIDEETRIPKRGFGCARAPFWAPVHNGTLRAMHRLFGLMPGTYRGPLPTAQEVNEALDDRGIDLQDACVGHTLVLGDHRFVFDPGDDRVCWKGGPDPERPDERETVVMLEELGLVAVEFPRGRGPCDAPGSRCVAYVFDPESGIWLGRPPGPAHFEAKWRHRDQLRRGLTEAEAWRERYRLTAPR